MQAFFCSLKAALIGIELKKYVNVVVTDKGDYVFCAMRKDNFTMMQMEIKISFL